MATAEVPLLGFHLGEMRYALEVHGVHRALRTVAISPLPAAPSIVIGVINVAGRILPVVDLRARLGLSPREPGLDDRLLWVESGNRELLLPVDRVDTVQHFSRDTILRATDIPDASPLLQGIVRLPDGLMFIQDLIRLLDLPEREALDRALTRSLSN